MGLGQVKSYKLCPNICLSHYMMTTKPNQTEILGTELSFPNHTWYPIKSLYKLYNITYSLVNHHLRQSSRNLVFNKRFLENLKKFLKFAKSSKKIGEFLQFLGFLSKFAIFERNQYFKII